MKIIVGLGNPGNEYQKTRHNAGWMLLDALAETLSNDKFKENKKFRALVAEGEYEGEKILLVKPLTYMNLSGEAVSAIMGYYKVKSPDIWVLYDDLDLPLGQLRIRKEGSPGTHNGMRSLIQHIGQKFPRFRIGIEGRDEHMKNKIDAADYVLSAFTAEEREKIDLCLTKAIDGIKTALKEGIEAAISRYNERNTG